MESCILLCPSPFNGMLLKFLWLLCTAKTTSVYRSTEWIYYSIFTHSLLHRNVSCSQFFSITRMIITHVLHFMNLRILLRCLVRNITVESTLLDNAKLFFKVNGPIYTPIAENKSSFYSISPPKLKISDLNQFSR